MRKAIDQDTLSALVETGAMRDFRAEHFRLPVALFPATQGRNGY